MIFMLCILVIAALTACLPIMTHIASQLWHAKIHTANPALPVFAAVIFVLSFYLPDIGISPETNTFQQHLVGGGVYSAILYIYFRQLLGVRHINWLIDIAMLFAWVSSLGVINKLAEFMLLKTDLLNLDTTDAYWDLLANTIGAYLLYGSAKLLGYVLRSLK
jgi:hypothetical protein